MIQPPKPDEHAEYYGRYIQRVPLDRDIFLVLSAQAAELSALLQHISDEHASVPPQVGEWSVKEVLGHINDTERILSYRALRIARGDTTPLGGFDQDEYVRGTQFNQRTLNNLLEEFSAQRRANVLCFTPLTEAEIDRRGTASDYPFSVRALLFSMAGHVMHHMESLTVDYKVG